MRSTGSGHDSFSLLSRIPPWVFLVGFVAVVLSFALMYYSLPGEFFHVYSQHEPSSQQNTDWLKEKLNDVFASELIDDTAIGDAYIVSCVATERGFEFDLELSGSDGRGYFFGLTVPMSIDVDMPIVIVPPEGERYFAFLLRQDPDTVGLFPLIAAGFYEQSVGIQDVLDNASRGFTLREDDYRELRALHDAHQGFPDEVSGGFWRMLYFSVVTVTTLGYGDIVPLTGNARILIGFESALGVVLLGLLVSTALARARRLRK